MVKLYFKKLLSIFLYGAAIVAIYYVGYAILATFSNFFRDYPIVRYAILFGIPLGIVLRIIWTYRVENAGLRREFLSCHKEQSLSFKEKCQFMMGFSYIRAEISAFATYAFVFVLLFGIANADSAAWYANLMAGVLTFLLIVLICLSLDLLIWYLIYRKWLRES